MFDNKSIYSRVLLSVLTIVIIFVFSGLAILAIPKPAKAMPVLDYKKFFENILLAIWKFAIYPLLQKIVMRAVTKGDWALTEDEIKKWATQDLAFQAANAVFNGITGMTLCGRINNFLKLSISKYAANINKGGTPSCTFDRSELVQLITMDPVKREEEIRKKLFQNLLLQQSGSNNDIGLTMEAFGSIMGKIGTDGDKVKQELSLNSLLATRDCKCDKKYIEKIEGQAIKSQAAVAAATTAYESPEQGSCPAGEVVVEIETPSEPCGGGSPQPSCESVPKDTVLGCEPDAGAPLISNPSLEDTYCINGEVKKEYRPRLCKKTSLDDTLKNAIKKVSPSGDQFGGVITATILTDLVGLTKNVISTSLQEHVLNPFQKWVGCQLTDCTKLAPTYTQTGENRIIDFPYDDPTPSAGSLTPDLIEGTP